MGKIQSTYLSVLNTVSSLKGLSLMKRTADVIAPKDLYSDDTKTEIKNMQSATKKIINGKATLDEKGKEDLQNHIKELEARAYGSPLPEYTPYGVSKSTTDKTDGSLNSPSGKIDPILAQSKAEKAIADKQLEYEIAKGNMPGIGKMDPIMSRAKSDTWTYDGNNFVKEG